MNPAPNDCMADDELGSILDLPATDARRLHVDSCTRCAAKLASYRRFVDATGAEPLLAEEASRLAAHRARLVSEAAPGHSHEDRAAWRTWLTPAWRPALAFAAIAIVAGALLFRQESPLGHGSRAVRGPARETTHAAEAVQLENGDVRFAWPSVAGADHYEVQIHSTALGVLARFDAGADTLLRVRAADLPSAYRDGEVVLFRVAAYSGGDVVNAGTGRPLQKLGARSLR